MSYLQSKNRFVIEDGQRSAGLLDEEIFHKACNQVYDKYTSTLTNMTDSGDDVREMTAKMREQIYRLKALEDVVEELHLMFNIADNAQYDAELFGE